MKKLYLSGMLLLIASLASCGGTSGNNTSSEMGSSNGIGNTSETENSSSQPANATIKVYTRDTTSGTRDGFFTTIGFEEAIKDDTVLVDGAVTVDGNGSMINSIKNDEYGIGYASLSGLDGVKTLKYNGVEATEANVLNETYGLKRNFNYVTRTEFTNTKEEQIVEAFVAYLSTQEAKVTIKANGGIVSVKASDPKWEDIKGDYQITQEDNSGVTIKFGGSTSVEKIAKALSSEFSKKCGNFKTQHNHTGSGDAYKRVQGSEKDSSNSLHIGFASREFKLSDSEPCEKGSYGLICIDAIAVIVNNENQLEDITAEKLKNIYDGTFTKWSEVE